MNFPINAEVLLLQCVILVLILVVCSAGTFEALLSAFGQVDSEVKRLPISTLFFTLPGIRVRKMGVR